MARLAGRGRYGGCARAGALAALAYTGVTQVRTATEAQALVGGALQHIRAVGREQAFADFSRRDGGFADGEQYVFRNAAEGVMLADGGNPKLFGRNLAAVRNTLENQPVAEIDRIALTQERGWHEYVWTSPATGLVRRKKTCVVRIDGHTVCGSGCCQASPP
jgi:hypothetical protein